MSKSSALFSDHLWLALKQARSIQMVFVPELGVGFYQWLLKQAQTGVEVEMILGYPYTIRNAVLTTAYYQQFLLAKGNLFIHSGQHSLLPIIIGDELVLLPERFSNSSNELRFKQAENTNQQDKIRSCFQQYREVALMPSTIEPSEAAQLNPVENPLFQGAKQKLNIRFYATPKIVGVYQHFELNWEVEGAQEIQIEPLLGKVPAKGKQVLSAEKSLEFRLTAINGTQSLSSVAKVEVDARPYLEYVVTALGAGEKEDMLLRSQADYPDRYGIIQGQVLQLNWRVINTEQLQLDGIPVPLLGNILLTPSGLNAYHFSTQGPAGGLSKTIIIDAVPRPEMANISLSIPESEALQSISNIPPIAAETMDNAKWSKADPFTINIPEKVQPLAPIQPFGLRDFLWFCSGASREVLLQCPDFERNKYAGIGATVLFTGLLAALSGGYALYVAFRSILGALFFALIWGTAIFNLDRLIVSSIRKEAGIRKQIGQSIPRFLLALVLSVVIAKPMEIRIFQPEIEEILATNKAEKIARLEQQFRSKIQAVDAKVASIKAETQANFQIRENLYQEYRCECDGTCGTGKVGRGSECERKEAKYRQADEEYQALKVENESLIKDLRAEIKTLGQKSQVAQQTLKSQFTEGLMARLSAANQLPFWPSFFISLLIFLIEVAPILSKILIPAGPYDKAIQVQERSFAAVQDQLLYQQTEQSNKQTDLQEQQQQLEAEQQLERNREILRMIAGAQIQLVRDQVNRWMENERNKLKKG